MPVPHLATFFSTADGFSQDLAGSVLVHCVNVGLATVEGDLGDLDDSKE